MTTSAFLIPSSLEVKWEGHLTWFHKFSAFWPTSSGNKSLRKPLKKLNWACNTGINTFRNHLNSDVALTNKLLSSSRTASPHSQARLVSCNFSRLFLKTPPQFLKVCPRDKLLGERVRREDRKPTIPQHHRSWPESRVTVRRHQQQQQQQHTGAVCPLPHTRPPYILSLYSRFQSKTTLFWDISLDALHILIVMSVLVLEKDDLVFHIFVNVFYYYFH